MKCQCERCSDSPSPTYTQSFRVETEARYWLKRPLQQRRAYLEKLTPARREVLQAEMTQQWKARGY